MEGPLRRRNRQIFFTNDFDHSGFSKKRKTLLVLYREAAYLPLFIYIFYHQLLPRYYLDYS